MGSKFLSEVMTDEKADELIDELGFLGLVDLVTRLSERMTGGLCCRDGRVTVEIKPLRKKKPAKKVGG